MNRVTIQEKERFNTTFEDWFKKEHGSYILDVDLIDDHANCLDQWKVQKLLREAFEAGGEGGDLRWHIKGLEK